MYVAGWAVSRTYGRLSLVPGPMWRLDAEPHIHMRAKRLFGKLSKSQVGHLDLSCNPETCRDLEWFTDRYPLVMSGDDRQALREGAGRHRDYIARLEELIDPNYQPQAFTLALPARSYQAKEAEIYLQTGALLIADDVGLGKTAAAICSFTDGRTLPAVVVTLAHLPRQWEYEIKKFAPGLNVHRVRKGTPYPLPKFFGRGPDVLITSYHKLGGWAKVLVEYAQSIVFDEIQELRHSGTQRYEAARLLTARLPFKLGLSATPIYNYGGEIYNILQLLKPGALGTRTEFGTEWCKGGDGSEKGIIKEPRALGSYLREQFLVVRHTRRDVGRELPNVIKIPQTIGSDRAALDRVENSAGELARIILGLRQSEKGAWQASEELSNQLRQATGIAKAPYVADFVRLLVQSGERVVLCGWHRAVYDIWRSKLADLRPLMYTGTESPAQKEETRQAFMRGQSPVLILSLRSGAGMNGLQEVSSVIVFGELDWSPGVHEQCIGRLNRDGQKTPVVAYFLVSEDGSDPVVAETLGLKREQVEGIRNPTLDIVETIDTDGARAKRLAEVYLRQLGQKPDKDEDAA